jgi:hypothetical protein
MICENEAWEQEREKKAFINPFTSAGLLLMPLLLSAENTAECMAYEGRCPALETSQGNLVFIENVKSSG